MLKYNVGFNYFTLKLIFHWIPGLSWPPNANEIDTKNMKCTWPTRKKIRFGVGGKANFHVFRYQHVGIGNAKLWHWGS